MKKCIFIFVILVIVFSVAIPAKATEAYNVKFTPLDGMGLDGWTGFYYAQIRLDVGDDRFLLTVDGQ